ncbi:MAG: rod shape-determining protein RodA [Rhodothermaceae bacterium]|nr:rod shape-determining protein RodA [Rhodothermaceae bacterium]MYD18019.1 rod shape-determining protein RodA [Rhodothermaceae bacterium]MYI42476.1 rod shape-determining protein RodA [Rhodothermaceae bacterium]
MRRWYKNLDFPILLVWVALCICGLIAIYSATHGDAQEYLLNTVQRNFQRQIVWLFICVGALSVIMLLPIRLLIRLTPWIYLASMALLVIALVFGREVSGARSWVYFGPFGFQSSELAKVGTLLMAAFILSSRKGGIESTALPMVGVIALPAILVILQNDLGTALVFVGLIPILWLWAGIRLRVVGLLIIFPIAGYLTILDWTIALGFTAVVGIIAWFTTRSPAWVTFGVLAGVITLGVASFALNAVFQPHQVARIESFLNPEADEYRAGVGFHLVQSKAALGSGGWFGEGHMKGSQTQGRYIPEQSTDFVFSVIGEEWGFVGSILVLLLFAILMLRLVRLAREIEHPFGSIVAAGTAGIFLIHISVNIGMVLGLLPVIGIPLPFLSYGGSALLTNTTLMGLALAAYMRRSEFAMYI